VSLKTVINKILHPQGLGGDLGERPPNTYFGGMVDVRERTTKVRRPGAGPTVIAFSRAEVNALATYATGYPLEEATDDERHAFHTGLDKIRRRAEQEKDK